MFNRPGVNNLNINSHLNFKDNNGSDANLHENYPCKSLQDVSNAFDDIKKDIDDLEAGIEKKISVIKIEMSGLLMGQQIDKKFDSFHAFREFLSHQRTPIIDDYVRECGFQMERPKS